MRLVTPEAAVAAIPDGARVILPHGAVEPTVLYRALVAQRQRFRDLHLYSGLQFGDYPFLRQGLGENFHYATWQASPKLRQLFRDGRAQCLPIRFRDIVRIVAPGGPLAPDVTFVQTTLPRDGKVSLGISVSLYPDLIAGARLVIAEMNRHMPWTCGPTEIAVEAIDLAVESGEPLGTYTTPRYTHRDACIVENVLRSVPGGAWVQLGVGSIPDAVLPRLSEIRGVNLHSGMLSDGLVDFARRSRHQVRIVTGEVAGGPALYEFVRDNPQVEFHPSTVTHDVPYIASLPRFVSINSAVEIDLHGQINGETVDGLQISGVGGSLDFVEGAAYSSGGRSIVALPSTTEGGKRSKIVARFSERTPVTIPRFCADVVVTEHGTAELRGKTLRERAEALIAIAAPEFREELANPAPTSEP